MGNADARDYRRVAENGRRFFVVDIKTGEIILEYSSNPSVNYPNTDQRSFMTYSFPSVPTAADLDGNGYVDRVYIGDLGGQMWAFNVSFNAANKTSNSLWSAYRLTMPPASNAEKHPVFYQPAIAFDDYRKPWVYYGTGDRENPLDTTHPPEFFYAVKDDGIGVYPRRENQELQEISSVNTFTPDLTKKGWYLILDRSAQLVEKVLARPVVFDNILLVEGDSGTGKELVARAIHHHSPNRKGPFVAVNFGALPDTLIESELFGYRAGAFTDARQDKPGRFALAQNGTLFLDEIGDISMPVQVRLLRVLQERIYEPLGSNKPVATNARVIAATHRKLDRLVREEKFREDLYFRINVFKITLPRLADHREDIPLLVDHFIERFNHQRGRSVTGITPEALAALMLHDWPGNVRELENAVEHAFVLCRNDLIRVEDLPEHLVPLGNPASLPAGATLQDIEKMAILQALQRNQGRKMATARELGIDKNTLRRKMIRLGIRAETNRR